MYSHDHDRNLHSTEKDFHCGAAALKRRVCRAALFEMRNLVVNPAAWHCTLYFVFFCSVRGATPAA